MSDYDLDNNDDEEQLQLTDDPLESVDEDDEGRSTAIDLRFFKLFVEQVVEAKQRDCQVDTDSDTLRTVLLAQQRRQDVLIERTVDGRKWYENLNVPVICRSTHKGVLQQRWFYNLPDATLNLLERMVNEALGGKPWETLLTSLHDHHLFYISPHNERH